MPARFTTASQPSRAAASIRCASQPVLRDSARGSCPASRSALTTCRPRKPVPPITAITPMPLVYEHVHNYASTIRNREREGGSDLAVNTHGTPAVRWELGFGSLDVPPDPKRGEGGLERGLG